MTAGAIWLGSIFARDILTLNIESTDIRFMLSKGRRVKKWGSVPLNPGVVREGLIVDHESVCTAVDELISQNRLKKGKTVVSLSGNQTVNRTIELPKMPRKLLPEAIMSEAQRVMPVSMEQTYLSWYDFGGRKEEIRRFLLLGVPQNMMDEKVRCLRQAGLTPRSVHLKPIALAEMVNLAQALIIDIESESCNIIVVTDGIPTIMRSITINPQYSPSEKAQYVLEEFERTLRFYESSYPDDPIAAETPLFLTGELAENDELRQSIASGTGHAVALIKPSLRFPADFPVAKFAVNIALARKGKSLASNRSAENGRFLITDFNILPDVYRPRGIPKGPILFVFAIIAGVALTIPLYNLADEASSELSQLKAENNILDQRILVRQTQNKQVQQLKDAIAVAAADLESVRQGQPEIADYLGEIQDRRLSAYNALYTSTVSLRPDEMTFTAVSQADGEILLTGRSPDYQTVIDYGYALRERDEDFLDVIINKIEGQSSRGLALTLTDTYVVKRGGTLNVPAPGVLENDTDEDGDRLGAIVTSDPEFGSLTLNRDGSFTYGHSGLAKHFDLFTYKVTDGVRYSEVAVLIYIDFEGVGYTSPEGAEDFYGTGSAELAKLVEEWKEMHSDELDAGYTQLDELILIKLIQKWEQIKNASKVEIEGGETIDELLAEWEEMKKSSNVQAEDEVMLAETLITVLSGKIEAEDGGSALAKLLRKPGTGGNTDSESDTGNDTDTESGAGNDSIMEVIEEFFYGDPKNENELGSKDVGVEFDIGLRWEAE